MCKAQWKELGGVLAKTNLASSNQEASDQVWYLQASQANQKYQGYKHYKMQDFWECKLLLIQL